MPYAHEEARTSSVFAGRQAAGAQEYLISCMYSYIYVYVLN